MSEVVQNSAHCKAQVSKHRTNVTVGRIHKARAHSRDRSCHTRERLNLRDQLRDSKKFWPWASRHACNKTSKYLHYRQLCTASECSYHMPTVFDYTAYDAFQICVALSVSLPRQATKLKQAIGTRAVVHVKS